MKNRTSAIYAIVITLMLLIPHSQLFSQEFEPLLQSFEQYKYPDWFRDAKFGIWSHWGPQAVPRQGDWYARQMYIESEEKYKYHLEHYGHPSEFGYKDIIPLWKAERWQPEKLMKLYKKTGAKYFVSMATHHDNFFLWNSKIHKWNSVQMGPQKDVVGMWQKAAEKEGLRFGVSEHLGASYTWYQPSHGADKTGTKAGIPYDGNNPEFEDLYHPKASPADTNWLTIDSDNQKHWLTCIKELIDMYQPDLIYSDSKLPFEKIGRTMLAHYYNQDQIKNNGELEAVYTCKLVPSEGRWVRDIERGVMDSISPYPWQTDTSIGDWYYKTGQDYKSGTEIIQMLVDIVSKNGNLLINVVQTPEGDLEPDILQILDEIGRWTKANGEGIYGTRPWKIYGEGPSTEGNQQKGTFGGLKDVRPYEFSDIRFTTKDGVLFAFCMNSPEDDISIQSLAKKTEMVNKTVSSVKLMGGKGKITWSQDSSALTIRKPKKLPDWSVVGFKIEFQE